jgi:hypothetical protein
MKRALGLAAVAFCALALGAVAVAPASARGLISTTCPAGSQLIASGSTVVTLDSVTGADPSNVWATANYTRTFQLYRVSGHTFCATWRDSGTFTTVGSMSPAGTGTVDAGVIGNLTRTRVETFSGTFWPHGLPTSGDLLSAYFVGVSDVNVTWYVDLYTTPANGAWGSRTGFPSYCDITSV